LSLTKLVAWDVPEYFKRILVIAVLLFAGCATAGKEVASDKVSQIQKGVTTEADVLKLLGTPQTKTLSSDGKVIMLYQFTKVKTKPATLIPVVGLLAGGMDMRMQMLTILVGTDGKVENYTLNDSMTDVNSGLLNT
jgi:outer membrane protein assembly factor BamE (lipoprotein component of BamABCDE complex)